MRLLLLINADSAEMVCNLLDACVRIGGVITMRPLTRDHSTIWDPPILC